MARRSIGKRRSTPGGIDPDARVRQMDEEGIDIALLYLTIGLCWEGECQDPGCPPLIAGHTTTTV